MADDSIALPMERSPAARTGPLLWAALPLAWAVLAWLARQPAGSATAGGAREAIATAVALLAAWILPGALLWRRLAPPRRSPLEAAAFSFGLGLAFLLVLASAALAARSSVGVLAAAVAVASFALLAMDVWYPRRAARAAPAVEARDRPPAPHVVMWAAALAVLLAASASARGFTFGGDEWFNLRAARLFLESDTLSTSMLFDAWTLVLALLVRLSGADLVETYRLLLPPFLIAGGALAFLALARAVLRRWSAVSLAFGLQALLCLSDMHTRGEGAGMALLARIAEDKYAGLTMAVPLALAALLGFVRTGARAQLVLFAALSLAAVLLQPLALFWIGLPAAAVAGYALKVRRAALRWPQVVALAALALAALAVGFALRALRPAEAFSLYRPDWPFNAQLLNLSQRQLLILSLEKGWFMAHGALLAHPLTVAALLATLRLARRFGRSLSARFLVSAMVFPVLLAYNPLTATWLGGWIMPWMVHRLLWPLPVALVLAATLHEALAALEGRLRGRRMAAPAAPLWLGALAFLAAGLAPRIERSLGALQARNRVYVSAGERDLMRFVSTQPRLRGIVLAPRGVSVRVSAWTSRLLGCPGMDALRSPGEHGPALQDCHDLLKAKRVDEGYVTVLGRRGIGYVIAPNGSSLDRALAPVAAFEPLYRGEEYSFYEWRRERWPPPPS
jgi:hypothetical protein